MFGDWGGTRTALHERGYEFDVGYVGEVATNLSGGYNDDQVGRFTGQLALGARVDLEKVFGWNDAEFKFSVTERSGQNLSRDRIGDPRAGHLSSVQEVWGRGQTWRLTQLWYRQKYFDGALDVKLGRFGPGEDFNSFPCDFQNLAFCGSQVGAWAGGIWYNWPVSQWATRVRYNVAPEWFVQVGAYEQNPANLDDRRGFTLSTSGRQGTLVPVELVWQPRFGADRLPGEYRAGYYYSTSRADDVYEDVDGLPQPLSGAAFKSHDRKHGAWVVVQQQLTVRDGDASRGLKLFANYTTHDKATNVIDNFQQIGLVYKGPFDARPQDDIGVGVARIHVNEDVRRRQALLNEVNGVSDYLDPLFQPLQDTEYNAEVYYGVHVADWLTVRPNLQYVRHPGGVEQVENAFVAGIKLQTSF
ncbi:carbohydrate porin [Stenotrophomonas sp. SY1]|uniref:carbohydrate porin n=1 Tax=Stenotrophomonas sp. SY1 TaxID=477235 RepID=UPI0022B2CDA1|nr:carbohydrate porin [Stenotrophomonas sp. SY1]